MTVYRKIRHNVHVTPIACEAYFTSSSWYLHVFYLVICTKKFNVFDKRAPVVVIDIRMRVLPDLYILYD